MTPVPAPGAPPATGSELPTATGSASSQAGAVALRWDLEVSPVARGLALAVWLLAACAGFYDVVQSVTDGNLLRTIVVVLALFALAPSARWLVDRRRQVALWFSPGTGWWSDAWGPIQTPAVVLDGGSWMCLAISPSAARNRRRLWVPVSALAQHGASWARLRQLLQAAGAASAGT